MEIKVLGRDRPSCFFIKFQPSLLYQFEAISSYLTLKATSSRQYHDKDTRIARPQLPLLKG